MSTQHALALPLPAASNTVVINARCSLRIEADQRVIVVGGLPVHHYRVEDAVAEAYAMVFLVESGFAQQTDVARAFGRSERTVRRHQGRYAQGGMTSLGREEGWRRGRRRIAGARLRTIELLKSQGMSNRAIAHRLGVSEKAIRKQVGPSKPAESGQLAFAGRDRRAGAPPAAGMWSAHSATKLRMAPPIGGGSTPATTIGRSARRRTSRAGADEPRPRRSRSQLRSACSPIWGGSTMPHRCSARGRGSRCGVLLTLPCLVESGLFGISRKLYGEVGPAFYGLRTTLLTLLFMALLRIQRPEHLKERDPAAFGRLLGLDRAPEVKTLRRRLTRLAAHHRAEQLGAELARRRVDQRGHLMGFLYVDGHVRAYHGQRPISSNAYVARRHLAMPATTDYWINDRSGDPLLVITGDVDPALTKALPRLLRQVRDLVGERRVTIVFDRGGWSPKLFDAMIKDGFDLLTYRKGRCRRIHQRRFIRRRARLDGRWVDYLLHDQPVRFLKGKLRLRQVTRLCDNGHQTQVITSSMRTFATSRSPTACSTAGDRRTSSSTCARSSCSMRSSTTGSSRRTRPVPSPIPSAAPWTRRSGPPAPISPSSNASTVPPPPTMPSRAARPCAASRSPMAASAHQLRTARARVARLIEAAPRLPKLVEVRDLNEQAVVKLATERKHLTDIIKMVAYQAESDLLTLLRPHYARAEQEGRTLLHELFAAAGDIPVSDRELSITLAPLSSPHRTRAAQALCDILDQTETIFPGSRLRMRFAVRPPPRIGLAFPGSPVQRNTATAGAPAP